MWRRRKQEGKRGEMRQEQESERVKRRRSHKYAKNENKKINK